MESNVTEVTTVVHPDLFPLLQHANHGKMIDGSEFTTEILDEILEVADFLLVQRANNTLLLWKRIHTADLLSLLRQAETELAIDFSTLTGQQLNDLWDIVDYFQLRTAKQTLHLWGRIRSACRMIAGLRQKLPNGVTARCSWYSFGRNDELLKERVPLNEILHHCPEKQIHFRTVTKTHQGAVEEDPITHAMQ